MSVYMYMCMCMRTYMYVNMHMHMCMHMYMCIYMCMYVYMYIHNCPVAAGQDVARARCQDFVQYDDKHPDLVSCPVR